MVRDAFRLRYKVNDTIKLMFLADIHKQAAECNIEKLKRDLSTIDDKTYIIGVGDWFDSIVLSDPRYSKTSDSTKGEDILNQCVEEMYDIFKPHRERILGIGIGNHEWKYIRRTGFDPVKMLCTMLGDVKQLGYSAIYHLFIEHESGGHTKSITIFQHHGWGGGGTTEGANITKFAKAATKWDADMYVFGHVHKDRCLKELSTTLGIDRSGAWETRKKYLVITGAYLNSVGDGAYPSYSEEGGMSPAPLGAVVVGVTLRDKYYEISQVR